MLQQRAQSRRINQQPTHQSLDVSAGLHIARFQLDFCLSCTEYATASHECRVTQTVKDERIKRTAYHVGLEVTVLLGQPKVEGIHHISPVIQSHQEVVWLHVTVEEAF